MTRKLCPCSASSRLLAVAGAPGSGAPRRRGVRPVEAADSVAGAVHAARFRQPARGFVWFDVQRPGRHDHEVVGMADRARTSFSAPGGSSERCNPGDKVTDRLATSRRTAARVLQIRTRRGPRRRNLPTFEQVVEGDAHARSRPNARGRVRACRVGDAFSQAAPAGQGARARRRRATGRGIDRTRRRRKISPGVWMMHATRRARTARGPASPTPIR